MGAGALFMTVSRWRSPARSLRDMVAGILATALIAGLIGVGFLAPDTVPSLGTLMLGGLFITLFGGLPIGFALALAALIFIWVKARCPASSSRSRCARYRQFRAARDPFLHPRRLSDGGQRHVGSPDRAVAACVGRMPAASTWSW